MEWPQAPQACPHCGARVPLRAAWCSLCLTPVTTATGSPGPLVAQFAVPPIATGTAADDAAAAAADATSPEDGHRRAGVMLSELAVADGLGGLRDGVTGAVLRLGKVSRFALAFALAGGLSVLAVGVTALIEAVAGGG